MQKTSIKIGARSSNLALTMAFEVKSRLQDACNLNENSLKIEAMSTKGDRVLNQSLSKIGGKGLFTEEIENALLNYKIDIAVHSTKDMPSFLPDNLKLSAYVKRGAIEDCFVSANNTPFIQLHKGAIIGTSSLRRQALVRKYRPDLNIILLRGNVETRIDRVKSGVIDGTFLALCGMQRLQLESCITEIMDVNFFPPAPAQGCICLETRSYDVSMMTMVDKINDINTYIEISAEREFLKKLDGSCRTPICSYSRFKDNNLLFYGLILSPDGTKSYEYTTSISIDSKLTLPSKVEKAKELGILAAHELRNQAGKVFFENWN